MDKKEIAQDCQTPEPCEEPKRAEVGGEDEKG